MKVAVLSGKGGTGKTLLSVNLAACAGRAIYIDCDVEEPNGHYYFKPQNVETTEVFENAPIIDENKCNGCRKCVEFCAFNAIAFVGKKPLVFSEVCHGCGACALVCDQNAISEEQRKIGEIKRGKSGDISVFTGILNVGEASGMPVIQELLDGIEEDCPIFIDCPPGCGCATMECVRKSDYCLLVAEPTVFGTQNLEMVYDLIKLFDKPVGVILNKCGDSENPSEAFCLKNEIPIIGRIPFDEKMGLLNSEAKIAAYEDEAYRALFSNLLDRLKGVQNG